MTVSDSYRRSSGPPGTSTSGESGEGESGDDISNIPREMTDRESSFKCLGLDRKFVIELLGRRGGPDFTSSVDSKVAEREREVEFVRMGRSGNDVVCFTIETRRLEIHRCSSARGADIRCPIL